MGVCTTIRFGPLTREALLAADAAVGGSVVDHPEHPGSRAIGLLGHHLADQSSEGGDTGLGFATTEDSSLVDVPCGQVGPGSLARLHARLARPCGSDAVLAASGLDAGFLVGADYEIGRSQRTTLPDPLVEIKDSAGLAGEVRVPGEDPAAMMPRADGVLREQRQMVASPIDATSPRRIASCLISAMLKRERGRPSSLG